MVLRQALGGQKSVSMIWGSRVVSRGDLRSNEERRAEMVTELAGDVYCKIRFKNGLN